MGLGLGLPLSAIAVEPKWITWEPMASVASTARAAIPVMLLSMTSLRGPLTQLRSHPILNPLASFAQTANSHTVPQLHEGREGPSLS